MKTRIGRGTFGERYLYFWCPGCDECHSVVVERGVTTGPCWTWDGNREAPKIYPSILRRWTPGIQPPDGPEPTVCHSFVRGGNIEFLADCTHALAGQTVPIPEWPEAHLHFGIPDEEP